MLFIWTEVENKYTLSFNEENSTEKKNLKKHETRLYYCESREKRKKQTKKVNKTKDKKTQSKKQQQKQ